MLIIGASGFLGGHLLAAGRESGLEVLAAARRPEADALRCDLLDPPSIEACLQAARPDLIVNAAGAASVAESWERPGQTFSANATGVLNLLQAQTRYSPQAHVVCLSSADVYGVREEGELPLGEELPPRPVTPYGASKAAMELVCEQYARARDLPIAIVRTFNLVGPGQSPQFAIPSFAQRLAAAEQGRETVELVIGNGGAMRDFLDVRDGARALVDLSRQRLCGTYNLCSGNGATIADLVGQLAAAAEVAVTVREDPRLQRPADPPALVGDPRSLREAIGFEPAIPLSRSLADLLGFWRGRNARPS